MLRWYPGTLLRVVLELTYLPIVFMTVFVVYGLFVAEAPWSIGSWKGPGRTPDFWKVAGLVAVGWAVLALGWRGAGTLFKWFIGLWHLGLTTLSLLWVMGPRDMVVRGETVGLSLSVELIGPVVSLATLICAFTWIAGDVRKGDRQRSVSPLRRRNTVAACCGLAGLVASSLAYWYGFMEAGTVTCALACVAAHEVMRPINPSEELRKAFVVEGSASR